MLKLWRNDRPPAPFAAGAEPPQRPATDALIPRSRRQHYPKVVMTLVLGLEPEALRPLLAEIANAAPAVLDGRSDRAAAPPERLLEPVLVTDCLDFALFRDAQVIFEYLPSPVLQQRHAPDLAWDVYIARRLERLRHKWAPVRVVAIGATARSVLARQLASPFASPDLALLTGGLAGATADEHDS